MTEIGRPDVMELIDSIVDRGSPVTARRVHAHLHRFFAWCVSRGYIDTNPMMYLSKPGVDNKRDRVLSDEELKRVWNEASALGWPFGSAILFLILTGARRQEIGGLRWSEIKDHRIELGGLRTKNGHAHSIPLSAPALQILETIPRVVDCEFVFTAKGKSAIANWSRTKAKLDHKLGFEWRLHDLRRTLATGLQKLGTPLQVTKSILGHTAGSRGGIVGVYQRYDYANEKRAALEAWGEHVASLVR